MSFLFKAVDDQSHGRRRTGHRAADTTGKGMATATISTAEEAGEFELFVVVDWLSGCRDEHAIFLPLAKTPRETEI